MFPTYASLSSYLRDHALSLLVWLSVVLAPINHALATATALIFIDLATGLWAAHKRGEEITSRAMRRTIGKVFAYNFALVLGFVVETNLLGDSLPLVRIIGAWIGTTEFKSVLENMRDISGVDIWAALLAKVTGQQVPQTENPPQDPPAPPSTPSSSSQS